jgi:hypothetical protein
MRGLRVAVGAKAGKTGFPDRLIAIGEIRITGGDLQGKRRHLLKKSNSG